MPKSMIVGSPLLMLMLAVASPARAQTTPAPAPKAAEPNKDMKAVLDELAKLGGKPIPTLTAAEARKQPTPADAVKALLTSKGKSAEPPQVGKIDERPITVEGRVIPTRVYTPKGKGPFPVIVYFHGGGWVIATNDTYDGSARALAKATDAVVVSVEYRKAPENKFPAAHDDAFAAYQWVVNHTADIQGDATRIAVAGESAGGNLAASVAVMARDHNIAAPVYQLLVYPIAGYDMDTASYRENADAKPLNKPMMEWFFKQYLKSPADGRDPRISLTAQQNLAGLAPATVITAQIDPLRSEGQAYAEALRKAGVAVDYRNYDGVTHEFFGMGLAVGEAKKAEALAAKDLVKAFKDAAKKSKAASKSAPADKK